MKLVVRDKDTGNKVLEVKLCLS